MKKKGLVFDIHRNTTHDGPGIRTTVFLKGCPLRCKWCQNPESISANQDIVWNKKKCIGCLICVNSCTNFGIKSDKNGIIVNHEKVQSNLYITEKCPTTALRLIGKYWEADKLVKEICKDDIFFEEFEGGVTFSGGEPTLQKEFLMEILPKLKKRGENIALDTSGYTEWETLMEIFPYVDYFLYDIKMIDEKLHKEYTGVNPKLIHDNFSKLALEIDQTKGKHLWIRTPLIPGVTATVKNITEIAEFLKQNSGSSLEKWELCAFNNVCKDKYEQLNKDWIYKDIPLMKEKETKALLNVAKKYFPKRVIVSGLTSK